MKAASCSGWSWFLMSPKIHRPSNCRLKSTVPVQVMGSAPGQRVLLATKSHFPSRGSSRFISGATRFSSACAAAQASNDARSVGRPRPYRPPQPARINMATMEKIFIMDDEHTRESVTLESS